MLVIFVDNCILKLVFIDRKIVFGLFVSLEIWEVER